MAMNLVPYFQLSDPLEYMKITQDYGANDVDFYAQLGLDGHTGLDLRAQIGTWCFAAIDGTTRVYTDSGGGKAVRIDTDPIELEGKQWRLSVLCYHLDEQLVQNGVRVNRGQLIAHTGNTGRYTTAPHLHFAVRPEVLENGNWKVFEYNNGYWGNLDPKQFLTYKDMADPNPYNLFPNTLCQLTEGKGGFALWSGDRFYIDETDKILASHMVRNGGDTKGKTAALSQAAWDSYIAYNLKNEKL